MHPLDKKITSISNGNRHVVVVVNNSELYTWGDNSFGQLGNGFIGEANVNAPTKIIETADGVISGMGNITEVKCGDFFTFLKVSNSDKNLLYCWGSGNWGVLGLGNEENVVKPKQLTNALIDDFSNFYVGIASTFAYNDKTHKLYGWGMNDENQLGIEGANARVVIPTEVTVLPAEKIIDISSTAYSSRMLTESGKIYTSGSGSGIRENGLNKSATTFTEIPMAVQVTNMILYYRTTLAFTSDKMYAWGLNDYGAYGNGTTTLSPTPTLVDPFSSTPSSLKQIETDNNMPVSEMAKLMYDETTGINLPFVNQWVQTADFPADAVFTMKTAPVVDEVKREITLTISASRSYSAPDGAKTLDVDFPITLTGFKAVPDSALTIKGNKPWIDSFKYENIETELGEGELLILIT